MNSPTLIRLALCITLVSLCIPLAAAEPEKQPKIDPLDWPHWRGPEMNGISRETGLVDHWSPDGENLLWKNSDVAGRSTPIVLRGKLYLLTRNHPGTTKEGEKVVCLDAATGKQIWENAFNVYLSDVPDTRVGWSSVVGDPQTGNVFALGVCGYFQGMDGETGKTLWSHSMSEEYGLLSTYGGRTNFPLVFEDLVIISGVVIGWGDTAMPAHRFIAFDKRTGQAVWFASTRLRPEDTTYSSPVLTVFNGQAAMVFGAGDGSVYALQPRTGKVIWKYDASIRGINTTPLVVGDTVYCGHSEEQFNDHSVMGALFAINGIGSGNITKTNELWSIPRRSVGKSAPLMVKDRLYVVEDGGTMYIIDPKDGREIGKQKLGTIMSGSAIYGDGKIYVGDSTGRWYILQPVEKGVKILQRIRLNNEEILGSPIISHGRIYIPTNGGLYCVGKKDHKPTADPRPEVEVEAPTSADEKPAHIQLVPVESLLKTGQSQQFQVRVYNAAGRYLKSVPAKFELKGPGAISKEGVFKTPDEHKQSATFVTATVDGMTSTARVRTMPPLPWKFDFADMQVPLPWIGAAYRFQPREVDGNDMLVKVTTIPKGTRSQSWIGLPDLHDYAVQAEVRGSIKGDKMPDIGLIAQRYTLDMMGEAQQLQIRSWTPQLDLRFAKTVPFKWLPDTWYNLKFEVSNQDGKAVTRGKVWPRGEKEPTTWDIEATDETPNTVGSPGLFGNASNAEIFIDNLTVTPISQDGK